MSDSENELLPGNVFTFQNKNTSVYAKGPNIQGSNMSSMSFRTGDRQHYREQCFDQRNIYRRGASPTSVYSCSDMRGSSFRHPFHTGGMSSHRSMYNGRSGSPMSMRSIDSNTTVSAADIASAFKNVNFNKFDLRIIKEAYNTLMKKRVRKRVEKKRNRKLFLKSYRRRSGYDSGELGSASSNSSDECMSTNSAMFKDNMSSCRSVTTDITDLQRTIQDRHNYNDRTHNFKNIAFKNMFNLPSTSVKDRFTDNVNLSVNQITMSQKERFKNGFQLPSQRFNRSVANFPIPEQNEVHCNPTIKYMNHKPTSQARNIQQSDYDEEIFSEVTTQNTTSKEMPLYNATLDNRRNKRTLEKEDHISPIKKRTKIISPSEPKTNNIDNNKTSNIQLTDKGNKDFIINKRKDDFEFLKPQFPIKKSSGKVKEVLISKSAPAPSDIILQENKKTKDNQISSQNEIPIPARTDPTDEMIAEEPLGNIHSNSDVSLRPSFIKRKLFSQKMDVTESKNISIEASNINSPQTNVYSAIQNEKHKARKLVTNQSCLNRDILQEDNNLLDLIHKIVPPDRMNVTNIASKTSISSKNRKSENKDEDDEKWDVSSVISTCKDKDGSDTYTDEEIFNNNTKNKSNIKGKKSDSKKITQCNVVLEKLPDETVSMKAKVICNEKPLMPNKPIAKKPSIASCIKSFWDTDFESDIEMKTPKRCTSNKKECTNLSMTYNQNKNVSINKSLKGNNFLDKKAVKLKTTSNNKAEKEKIHPAKKTVKVVKDKKKTNNSNQTEKENIHPAKKTVKVVKDKNKTNNSSQTEKENIHPAKTNLEQVNNINKNVDNNNTEKKNIQPKKNVVKESQKSQKPQPKDKKDIKITNSNELKITKSVDVKNQSRSKKIKTNDSKPASTNIDRVESPITRSMRTSKNKSCLNCTIISDNIKPMKKPRANPKNDAKSITTKINKPRTCKQSPLSKTQTHTAQNTGNKKLTDVDFLKITGEPIIRTLRTRKIDLSSSTI